MTIPLFTLKLQTRRDILVARMRARQLTGLLGFDAGPQLLLAAAVFELAWNAYQLRSGLRLQFEIEADVLHIFVARAASDSSRSKKQTSRKPARTSAPVDPALELHRALPAPNSGQTSETVAWSMKQLSKHTPLNLFEEIHLHNMELLGLALEGQRARGKTSPRPSESVA